MNHYYARLQTQSYHSCRETDLLVSTYNYDIASGAWNVGQGHRGIVCVGRVCYEQLLCKAWHAQQYSCKETDFNARVDVKLRQSQWSVKCRSMAPGHSVCWKSMLRTINHYAKLDTCSYHSCRELVLMLWSTWIVDRRMDGKVNYSRCDKNLILLRKSFFFIQGKYPVSVPLGSKLRKILTPHSTKIWISSFIL